jgi:3-deoxy-D-arabino-heptulosonate 7-phosphate (DAHP) synthase
VSRSGASGSVGWKVGTKGSVRWVVDVVQSQVEFVIVTNRDILQVQYTHIRPKTRHARRVLREVCTILAY